MHAQDVSGQQEQRALGWLSPPAAEPTARTALGESHVNHVRRDALAIVDDVRERESCSPPQ